LLVVLERQGFILADFGLKLFPFFADGHFHILANLAVVFVFEVSFDIIEGKDMKDDEVWN
jgi:hypothetical protein